MAAEPIHVEPEDEVPTIVERIRNSSSDEVHLVLPAHARVARSRFNFQLLKQYSTRLGKRVAIVSPDPGVQRIAAESGFGALRADPMPTPPPGPAAPGPLRPRPTRPGPERGRTFLPPGGGAGAPAPVGGNPVAGSPPWPPTAPAAPVPPPPGGPNAWAPTARGPVPASTPAVQPRPLDTVLDTVRKLPGASYLTDLGLLPPAPAGAGAGGGTIAPPRPRPGPGPSPGGGIRIGTPTRIPLSTRFGTSRGTLYLVAGVAGLVLLTVFMVNVPTAEVTLVVKASPFSVPVSVKGQSDGKAAIKIRTATYTAGPFNMTVGATGTKSQDSAYATGQVVYDNACNFTVVIPNGQRLTAVTGQVFAELGAVGMGPQQQQGANIKAVQPGQGYNVGAGQITTIDNNGVGGCLTVTNQQATAGGADGQKQQTVQSSDIASLRAQLDQKARQDLQSQADKGKQNGEQSCASCIIYDSQGESFQTNHQVDDVAQNVGGALSLKAEVDYYLVADVNNAFASQLQAKVPAGEALTVNQPAINMNPPTASGSGNVYFGGSASGYVYEKIDTSRLRGQLAGKTGGSAKSVLDTLPITRSQIHMHPIPLPFLPFKASNITIDYAVDQVAPIGTTGTG